MTPVTHGRTVPAPARQRSRKPAGAALSWALVFFLGFQGALVLVDRARPGLLDPEFGIRLAKLQALQARYPDRPLVLLLGTSRTCMGLWPEEFAGLRTAAGQTPLVFNFGMAGTGVFQQLVCLRQLLARGLRPSWVLTEILPPKLCWHAAEIPDVSRLRWQDVNLLETYLRPPKMLRWRWLGAHALPCFVHRFALLFAVVPKWMPFGIEENFHDVITAFGGIAYPHPTVDAATRCRGVAHARLEYQEGLRHFQITPRADRALRQLLELCRQQGIRTGLFLMPEGAEFRSWYPPAARSELTAYLAKLSQQSAVPVADLRTWMPEAAFADSHHLLYPAARAFSRRFGRDVLQPWMLDQSCRAPLYMPSAACFECSQESSLKETNQRKPLRFGGPKQ